VNDRTFPDNFPWLNPGWFFYDLLRESANDVGCPFARDTRDTQNMITIAHGCYAVWIVAVSPWRPFSRDISFPPPRRPLFISTLWETCGLSSV
jgi:hypothetical protein